MIESNGTAFIAIGVSRGGCGVGGRGSGATVFSISTTNNGLWQLTTSTAISDPLASGNILAVTGTWYTLTLVVFSDHTEAYVNGNLVDRCGLCASSSIGLATIGSSWDYVQFDNFRLQLPNQDI